MDAVDFTELLYKKEGELLFLTLNRPEAHNAYSEEMIGSIMGALDAAEMDDEIRCVILTGAGNSFSAGGDLRSMQEYTGMFEGEDATRLRSSYLRGIHQIPRRLARFDKPIIAAMNGAAIGAGLDLACLCDIRVAVEGAKLGSTFVRLGLIPGDGGAYILSRTVGFPKALEMILTGRVMTAEEGRQIGLVSEVVAPERLMERCVEIARVICQHAPLAVRLAKAACYQSWDMSVDQALHLAASYQSIVQHTADHQEGVSALLEKRKPVFVGK